MSYLDELPTQLYRENPAIVELAESDMYAAEILLEIFLTRES